MKPAELRKSVQASELGHKEEPMDSFYSHPLLGFYSRLRIRKILQELGDVRNKRVLDVGCEAGYVSLKISKQGAQVISFDHCKAPLLEFKDKIAGENIAIFLALAHRVPLKSETVDFAVCTEVIQLAPYLDRLLNELHRVLKTKGKLILTFPNEENKRKLYPIARLVGLPVEHQKAVTPYPYSAQEVKEAAGRRFKIIKSYGIPLPFVSLTTVMVCLKESRTSLQ
jgi:ubiquinone/menaquinone biosynthesis C-methylase UbiE